MFFTKNSVVSFPVNSLDIKEVIGSTSTLDVEGNHAFGVLALNTSTVILSAANNALKTESLKIYLRHSDGRFGCDDRSWNPHSTT